MKKSLLRVLRTGFTLLEILIVLVIIGTLAGLAVPAYGPAIEKMRSAEALRHLSSTRDAMMRYHTENNTYAGATIPLFLPGTLDYNPNLEVGGMRMIFSYDFSSAPAASTFTLRATRTPSAGCAVAPTGTVMLNQSGVVTKTGVYA